MTLRILFFLCAAGGSLTAEVTAEKLAAAEALYNAGRTGEARDAFAQLAAADPTHAGVQYHLGLVALQADDPKTAIGFFERAVQLAATSSEYHRKLGDAYGMTAMRASIFSKPGLAKKCLRAYEKAVETDPTSIGARWSVMEFYKQAPGFLGGSMTKAYEQAEEIRKLAAGPGRWAKALLLLHEGKSLEALALYETDLTAESPDYAALYQFGRLSQWSGQDLPRGRQALEKCLTLKPTDWAGDHKEVHYAIGQICEKQKNADAARAAYRAALNLDAAYKPALDALEKLR